MTNLYHPATRLVVRVSDFLGYFFAAPAYMGRVVPSLNFLERRRTRISRISTQMLWRIWSYGRARGHDGVKDGWQHLHVVAVRSAHDDG